MSSFRTLRAVLVIAAAGSTGLVAACARQGAPPGGPEDRRPPVVVSTTPEPLAVLTEPFRGAVRFQFDERISERPSQGTLDDAVLVSPRTGRVRIGHGRQDISVELDGGFKPGLVYRVTLLPVIKDLFNNQMRDPFELVFSTGGELTASAVAGLAWDRTNGEGMRDLDIHAVSVGEDGDTTVYVAKTDTGGVYVLRYLPPARYSLVAFEDRDRDGDVDRMEVQGTRGILISGADTLIAPIGVLQPDTTPARLTRATPLDSITLLLDFDDYLDPAVSASQIGVSLAREEGEAPGVELAFHEPRYLEWRQAVQDSFARLDSLEAAARTAQRRAAAAALAAEAPASPDSLDRDTVPQAPEGVPPAGQTVPEEPPRPEARDTTPRRVVPPDLPAGPPGTGAPTTRRSAVGGARGGAGGAEPRLNPDGQPLPARRVVLRLDGPLEANVAYQLTVNVVVNLNGLPLGGGEAAVVREPPKDSTAVADSTALADSAGVNAPAAGDTAVVPPDTSVVPPDTTHPARPQVLFLPGRRW